MTAVSNTFVVVFETSTPTETAPAMPAIALVLATTFIVLVDPEENVAPYLALTLPPTSIVALTFSMPTETPINFATVGEAETSVTVVEVALK